MKLATRLWLTGALLPVLVMAVVLLGADHVFLLALERSLDRALMAQAAVESVSLFDGPRGEPHLHMSTSPLVDRVRGFAPEGILFGPAGELVMRYPPAVAKAGKAPRRLPGAPGGPPVLTTEEQEGIRFRRLEVTVASPSSGEPYMLQLTANMAQVDASQAMLHRLSFAALAVIALVLVLVQSWQGRSLRRRLAELSEHAEALRAGDLEHVLPPEKERDEIAALRMLLVQATTALKQARDSKERLLADAAHELRTPLTLMRTGLDLALRRERSTDELKMALSDTRDEVDRLALLATRLLDSAALAHQAGPPESCDLAGLVREAVDMARPGAETRDIALTLRTPESVPAYVRASAVRQALDNLLSNALRFARHTIAVQLTTRDEMMLLAVVDDGPGVPEHEQELVFEPFHRVHQGGNGTGLGLAIVREIAHAHHGRAYVSPSPNGATFVLELRSLARSGKPSRGGFAAADPPGRAATR